MKNPRPLLIALCLTSATALTIFPATAQDTTTDTETASAPDALPDMAAIEQAYQKGDFVFVREGLARLAEEIATPLAQFRYGKVLLEGRGGPRDIAAAVDWLQKAVDQEHVEAATLLARVYLSTDTGLERDSTRAAQLLARAATRGNAEAQYYLGLLYSTGDGLEQSAEEAFNWFLAAAEQGNTLAQYEVSRAYSRGTGTALDTEKALTWLEEAAGNGHADAQLFLAIALDSGQGATQNKAKALTWYRRASEGGQVAAQTVLGSKYLSGEDVEQNYEEALRWLKQAAEAGNPGAQSNMGFIYATGAGVAQDDTLAFRWYEQAAGAGFLRAMMPLARFYETGRGVDKNLAAAVELYARVAANGGADAAQHLGRLTITGGLDEVVAPQVSAQWVAQLAQDGDEPALAWLENNAEAGMRQAQRLLGLLLLDSEARRDEAAPLLEQAAIAGDVEAQFRLGEAYTTGTGVAQDYVQAYKWLNIAAALGHEKAAETRDLIANLMAPDQISEGQALTRTHMEADANRAPDTEQTIQVSE